VDVDERVSGLLEAHYRLMLDWNKRLNLTRITQLDDAVERHYAQSLQVLKVVQDGDAPIVDVGSGAGFPGLVIGAARPDWEIVLLERDTRKAAFLKECSRLIANVAVENVESTRYSGPAKSAVSRAVSWRDLGRFAQKRHIPVAWITAAVQLDGVSTAFHVERSLDLPNGAGIIARIVPRGTFS
jgi:16S rRNA G527 N7-methylase RsmG